LRPEQEQLFKNVIPPKFWEESDKYHSLLDKIENEFTERRMKNLEKRQLRKNIHKKDSDLNKGDYCVIKNLAR
jgi:hypothetical protein